MSTDRYRTIAHSVRIELVIQSSRFIADAIPVADDAAAQSALAAARKEFHAATHHCSAWRLGIEQPASRFSDDGEPSGTAGRPILAALERMDVTNTAIIVTRYFGGTKLGTGGLARAYGDAAQEALNTAHIAERVIMRRLRITAFAAVIPKIKSLIYSLGTVESEEYGSEAELIVSVPQSAVAELATAVRDASRGAAIVASAD